MDLAVHPPAEALEDFDRGYRIREDTITWLAEVLDGSMRVPTEFHFDGHELYANDGSNLRKIFEDSVQKSERDVAQNPKLAFELRRRRIELDEYHLMVAMAQGLLPNTMTVVSDFPPELMAADVEVDGYNTIRKPTMLRVITAKGDGKIHMFTQSLDGTDRSALEDIYRSRGFEPQPGELLGQRMHEQLSSEEQEYLVDQLMGVYDRSLALRKGGIWRAGRLQTKNDVNTYEFVSEQQDLIDTFVEVKLRDVAAGEALRYGLAAAIEKRFESRSEINVVRGVTYVMHGQPNVWQEMHMAGCQAQAAGKTYSGCELSSRAPGEADNKNDDGPKDLSNAGYGDEDKKEIWVWKTGVCRVAECPTRPSKTKVGPCSVCACCQQLYDKGKDPAAEYKLRRASAKYN